MSFETPVVFLVFNRPEVTQRVFEVIAKARPQTLLLVADGPRRDQPNDAVQVAATRAIFEQIDWPCTVHRNFSEENLGCKQRVSSGLNWAMGIAEQAIILEDDCLPNPSFFRFCQTLLEKYREDDRVMVVSGNNFQCGRSRTRYSYYFSKYPHCWGWATWRRAWKRLDLELNLWPEFRDRGYVHSVSDSTKEAEYWTWVMDQQLSGSIKSWGYPWLFSNWIHNGLTILPEVNLVSNIGFGDGATHTTTSESHLADLPTGELNQIAHPPFVVRHKEADMYTFDNVFRMKTPIIKKLAASFRKRINRIRSPRKAA